MLNIAELLDKTYPLKVSDVYGNLPLAKMPRFGYDFVDFRKPNNGELFISIDGGTVLKSINTTKSKWHGGPVIIVKPDSHLTHVLDTLKSDSTSANDD